MTTIRSEGGLLPADILARVSELDPDLGGLAASDYHLASNERLGEAIARSWARLTAAWEAFSTDRDGLRASDHAGRLTRERWLLPLFSELGYGRLVQQSAVEVDVKTYAVFCEYNHSPVHLVGAGVPLDRRTAGVRGAADQSPHSVVQELLNRSRERLWGMVTNGLSLRLLRDNVTLTRQAYVEFDLEAILATEAYEDFALLWLCTHQSRLEAEVPRGVLAGALDAGGAARRNPRSQRTALWRRAGHRGARPRVPRSACKQRVARRAPPRQHGWSRLLPRAAAPHLPSVIPVRSRRPRRAPPARRRHATAVRRTRAIQQVLRHQAPPAPVDPSSRRTRPRPLRAG